MVKSPNKVITSGTAPTTTNTSKGDLAFGTVDGETKLYGNTGSEVVELGGGSGSEVNSIAPLTVDAPPVASGTSSIAIGNYSTASGYQSTATGYRSGATADYSTAIGSGSTVNGDYSTALGYLAGTGSTTELPADSSEWSSIGQYSVAIGAGSLVIDGEDNVVSFGNGGVEDYYKKFEVNLVGHQISKTGPETRRLIHVSDPTNDQDAATKKYVDAKIAEIPGGTTINSIAPLTVTNAPSSSSPSSVAIGLNARATASSSVAIGANAVANASNTVSFGSSSGTRRIIYVTDPANAQDAATKNYVDTQLEPINTKLQHFPETFADTGWMEITGSSGNGLKYLTGPWTIPVAAKVKIRKFGKRVTVVGVVQATEDISSDAATPLLSIPESDPHFDAFNLPQVSQYDIAHDQQKCAVTSAILVHGVLTSFNVEQNSDTPSINVTLVPVVGTAGLTAQIENGDTVNFQISWDTED